MRVEELLNEIQDIMNEAKSVPLTGGKSLVDTEKVLDILDEINDTLPSEVRQAKNIVADRGQIIAEAKKEKEKTCATCACGKGPLSAGGVRGKCYCTRTRMYEKSTHSCAEWKEKKKCQ